MAFLLLSDTHQLEYLTLALFLNIEILYIALQLHHNILGTGTGIDLYYDFLLTLHEVILFQEFKLF